MKHKFDITIDIPGRFDREDLANYIAEAVIGWMGQFHPASAILTMNDVTVKWNSKGSWHMIQIMRTE